MQVSHFKLYNYRLILGFRVTGLFACIYNTEDYCTITGDRKDLRALTLVGPTRESTRPPSCTTPRQSTIYTILSLEFCIAQFCIHCTNFDLKNIVQMSLTFSVTAKDYKILKKGIFRGKV